MFGPGSTNLADLNEVVALIDAEERAERAGAARTIRAYARMYKVAQREAASQPPRRFGARQGFRDPLEEEIAFRSAVADVAAGQHLTEHTIRRRIEKAHELDTFYAATVSTLETGRISLQHTNVILDEGRIINSSGALDAPEVAALRARYEALVLERARDVSPSELRPYARRIAEELAEKSLEERHECEKSRRRVWVEPADDGMAYLTAYLPAQHAKGIYDRLSRSAKLTQQAETNAFGEQRRLAAEAGEEAPPDMRRTRDELRADQFIDLLSLELTDPKTASDLADRIEAGAGAPAVRGVVQVIVHREHLGDGIDAADRGRCNGCDAATHQDQLGTDSNASEHGQRGSTTVGPTPAGGAAPGGTAPASAVAALARLPLPELEGYGPISVGAAREIAGRASHWIEATVNPDTGDVEEVTSRVPSADQKRKLLVRDEHCRWPGCRTPGYRCDIDHTVAVEAGGPTSMNNLGFLCRHHHTLKHHGGWAVRQADGAVYEFTSPTGRVTYTKPESRVRFRSAEDPPEPNDARSAQHEGTPASSNPALGAELGPDAGCDPDPGESSARKPPERPRLAGPTTNTAPAEAVPHPDIDSATEFPF